jgi:DNA-binding XRE family transcriptional regulator
MTDALTDEGGAPNGVLRFRVNRGHVDPSAMKAARLARALKQAELAAIVGEPATTLSSIENGHQMVSTAKARRIARALGLDLVFEE